MKRVVYINTALAQYSVPFQNGVRACLAESGVQYDAVLGQPDADQMAKGDEASLGWERKVSNSYIRIGGFKAVWQPVLRDIFNCDLAIVGQENRRLVNYVAQILGPIRPSRLAFWGHGRNFQASAETNMVERWKRVWATRCDWWFTYTQGTGKLIESYGFPHERITVFNNAIDTSEMRRWNIEIGAEEIERMRRTLKLNTLNVAVYVGALYDHKRIEFLIEAANEIRRHVPDFVLIIVGNGADRPKVERAVIAQPWIRYLGPRFGREKAAILKLGRVFMMPGLVGLAILDASAVGLPIVTTAYPYHSPEIEYLKSGENGLMVDDWQSALTYAKAIISVLRDDRLHAKLASGARQMAETYNIERMVQCFCGGVLTALAASKRR